MPINNSMPKTMMMTHTAMNWFQREVVDTVLVVIQLVGLVHAKQPEGHA